MTSRRWFSNPLCVLLLVTALAAFVVQSGELGTADTMHRLQSTHALWTSEPPVFPQEYPEFGIHGRGGSLQSWYGIGQSLLMLPADIIGTYVARLPIFADYGDSDPSIRNIIVSYSTNTLIAILTVLVCFRFLKQLGFDERQSILGVLALEFCTTHLHYTQNMMENNYIFLLTLTGISFQYEWLRSGSRRALLIGSGGLGLNLLTRITTGMDLLAAGLFLLIVLWFEGSRGTALWSRVRTYIATAIPVYLFFGLLDRLYQFYRFGSFFNTYITVVTQEARQRDPSLPAKYPFETPLHVGLSGALFSPEKSIFLFDPLLILLVLITVLAWKRFSPAVRAWIISTAALLLAYLCFYGRYTVWSGDFAWGDRYVSTTIELVALLAVPLLLRHRHALAKSVWTIGIALIAISAIIQFASLGFWLPLEIYQVQIFGHPTFIIGLRFENILAFTLGKMDSWGLNTVTMTQDPWDYVHITTWNFLPFLLKRSGFAPAWAVHCVFAVWMAALAALAAALWRLASILSRPAPA
jgi:hypothetical protein